MHDREGLARCAILAERNHALTGGTHALLGSVFGRVLAVVNDASLLAETARAQPDVVVAEMFFAAGDLSGFVRRLRAAAPAAKLLLLSAYYHPRVIRLAMAAGAEGLVVKRSIASDLLPAVDAVLAGRRYLSRIDRISTTTAGTLSG